MNTRNWQIKILTLCMAAIALCLTAACGDSFPREEPGAKRIMPLGPCPKTSMRCRRILSCPHRRDST